MKISTEQKTQKQQELTRKKIEPATLRSVVFFGRKGERRKNGRPRKEIKTEEEVKKTEGATPVKVLRPLN